MPRCPTCGTDYSDDAEACPACEGEPQQCARCGSEYRGSDSCPACGLLTATVPCDTHPERTARGRCVMCGRAVCEQCRPDERRVFLCDEHRGHTIIEGWAQVYTTTGEFEAQLVRDNLMAEGIDAQIFSQRDNIFAVEVGELSIVRILVPVWEYDRALQVIRDHMDPEGEVAFACPACGEAYDAGARECTSCGAALV